MWFNQSRNCVARDVIILVLFQRQVQIRFVRLRFILTIMRAFDKVTQVSSIIEQRISIALHILHTYIFNIYLNLLLTTYIYGQYVCLRG